MTGTLRTMATTSSRLALTQPVLNNKFEIFIVFLRNFVDQRNEKVKWAVDARKAGQHMSHYIIY